MAAPAHSFTLAEAQALLPRVRAFLEQAQAARKAILAVEPELWPALSAAAGNGHAPPAGRAIRHYEELRRAVRALGTLGVLLKDLDTGLVDFPSRRDGREVLLCWKMGEAEIGFWHELDAGFAGRRPLGGPA